MAKTRVVVVDDSALVRSLLSEIINHQPDMECIGAAADPFAAREMIRNLNPDVITLDVEMPRMDGIDFLSKLMRLRPMPVVMVSTLTERGAEVTLKALELGAIDFVAKPKIGIADGLKQLGEEITDKIRIAAKAHIKRLAQPAPARPASTGGAVAAVAAVDCAQRALSHLGSAPRGLLRVTAPVALARQHGVPVSFDGGAGRYRDSLRDLVQASQIHQGRDHFGLEADAVAARFEAGKNAFALRARLDPTGVVTVQPEAVTMRTRIGIGEQACADGEIAIAG